jgi:hypothetical protein
MSKKKKQIIGPATSWLLERRFDMTVSFLDSTGTYNVRLDPRDNEDIGGVEVYNEDTLELAFDALEHESCRYFIDRAEYHQNIANEAKYDAEHYEDLATKFPLKVIRKK